MTIVFYFSCQLNINNYVSRACNNYIATALCHEDILFENNSGNTYNPKSPYGYTYMTSYQR